WLQAARAICTTDTFPKLATATTEIDGVPVTINGIAKGSGMIAPDMATMLAYIFTDAAIPSEVLQTLLMLTVHDSFNMITVDGDTSTSDTVMLFATGKCAAHRSINRPGDPRLRDFREKLAEVATDLAQQIVRDGEGATKFVTITVTGAANARAARKIANSIANSPLVKTAIAGEDPNWGRIIMAVGKAGEAADRDAMRIEIGGVTVARDGMVDPDYKEATVAKYMKNQEIGISVDVGVGRGEATVWTCDLTHRYIEINADYRS
ncbi:MAG TPA: bifunctional ornithine acetyltransferase/N-acetylglutamate synthase, partial [Alphaproteobacteria bacterium]|nr:bifunctional ornithine acetyltransferase/N-acetylglutamate synthase [Alphaproteobacteria bacterium]